jgi:signal peptidase I
MRQTGTSGRLKLAVKDNLGAVLALAFAAAIIYLFCAKDIQFYLVPSESMAPTLMRSDYIGGFGVEREDLRRGDIIVYVKDSKDDFYVKRVVGLPGETLAIFNGMVYIDGRMLDEPYVVHRANENMKPVKIPKDRVFMIGDNRLNSEDSRVLGPVWVGMIEARVSFIYSPVSRAGLVQ